MLDLIPPFWFGCLRNSNERFWQYELPVQGLPHRQGCVILLSCNPAQQSTAIMVEGIVILRASSSGHDSLLL
jgi:hypothetical protein